MKIKRYSCKREDFELTRPYEIASRKIDKVSNYIIRLETDTGLIGFGAASPESAVTGETLKDCANILSRNWQDILGQYYLPDQSRELFTKLEELQTTPAARAAMDIAVYDLLSQDAKVPLCRFLGGRNRKLATSITIGIKPVDEVLKEADEYISRKFKILKLKLGQSLEEDLERVKKLSEFLLLKSKNEVKIRVDLNMGYTLDEFNRFTEETKNYNLEFCEQPLTVKNFYLLKSISQSGLRKIAADESLLSPQDAINLIRPNILCGIFNIKLMKCGGIAPAMRIAKTARKAKIELMWGCMDESRISIAAALHCAFACDHTRYLDLDGHLDLDRDVVEGGFVLKDGELSLVSKNGLGVQLL